MSFLVGFVLQMFLSLLRTTCEWFPATVCVWLRSLLRWPQPAWLCTLRQMKNEPRMYFWSKVVKHQRCEQSRPPERRCCRSVSCVQSETFSVFSEWMGPDLPDESVRLERMLKKKKTGGRGASGWTVRTWSDHTRVVLIASKRHWTVWPWPPKQMFNTPAETWEFVWTFSPDLHTQTRQRRTSALLSFLRAGEKTGMAQIQVLSIQSVPLRPSSALSLSKKLIPTAAWFSPFLGSGQPFNWVRQNKTFGFLNTELHY